MPGKGDLAVISQSGAIVAGMIEWAAQRAIGFSAVISVGDQVDVDFGDLLDLSAANGATRAIVLYVVWRGWATAPECSTWRRPLRGRRMRHGERRCDGAVQPRSSIIVVVGLEPGDFDYGA